MQKSVVNSVLTRGVQIVPTTVLLPPPPPPPDLKNLLTSLLCTHLEDIFKRKQLRDILEHTYYTMENSKKEFCLVKVTVIGHVTRTLP